MPLFSRKPKLSIEECCKQFYDANIFGTVSLESWPLFLGQTKKYISEVAPSFSSVNDNVLSREMAALRMELFALAWFKKFSRGNGIRKYCYPQSIFTMHYLEEKGNPELGDIMAAYNKAIFQSVTMNAKGELFSGGMGRAVITQFNVMRVNLFEDWVKNNPGDTEEAKKSADFIAHVVNRLGADYRREDGIAHKLLVNKLIERLGFDLDLESEAISSLAGIVFGFYQGAEDYLKQIEIQV